MGTLQIYAMSDYMALIENHLDSSNHEYQSYNNQIEIYSMSNNTVFINIKNNQLIITSDEEEYKFTNINDKFFIKLDKILANF